MKPGVRRFLIFLLLVGLSVGFGFGFDAIADAVEKNRHPRPEQFAPMISSCAEEYGVPEAVLWGVILTQSGFDSSAVTDDGRVGLFALSPELYETVCREILFTEPQTPGILYDPATNLRVGCAYLSYLFGRYGMWEPAFAAFLCGSDTVDEWLRDESLLTPLGTLKYIPDEKAAGVVAGMLDAADAYATLYK